MDIGNVITPMQGGLGGGRMADKAMKLPVKVAVPEAAPAPVKVPQKPNQDMYEKVRMASEAAKTLFVVSDVRFTIFKDVAGDYVTRFTSLRDGSVKYFPQKSLFEMMQIRNARIEGAFDTEV